MKEFDTQMFCRDILAKRGKNTQKSIAERLGLSRSTLSLIETGKQIPAIDVFSKICELYSMDSSRYFVDTDEKRPIVFMMGGLCDEDREKLETVLERIKIREKYSMLSRGVANASN